MVQYIHIVLSLTTSNLPNHYKLPSSRRMVCVGGTRNCELTSACKYWLSSFFSSYRAKVWKRFGEMVVKLNVVRAMCVVWDRSNHGKTSVSGNGVECVNCPLFQVYWNVVRKSNGGFLTRKVCTYPPGFGFVGIELPLCTLLALPRYHCIPAVRSPVDPTSAPARVSFDAVRMRLGSAITPKNGYM